MKVPADFQKWLEGKQKFEQGQNSMNNFIREYLEDKRRQKVAEQKTMAANGG
jgi:predicted CopG family antitoxin